MVHPKTGALLPVPNNAPIIEGNFMFDRYLRLESFWTNELESNKNRSIHDLAQAHPDWSEADAYKALKDGGARYGPWDKEDLLRSIHLQRFDKLLGHITEVSAEFQGFSNPDHGGDFAILFWVVTVDAQASDGMHRKYRFVFEPFDGRLAGIKHVLDR